MAPFQTLKNQKDFLWCHGLQLSILAGAMLDFFVADIGTIDFDHLIQVG